MSHTCHATGCNRTVAPHLFMCNRRYQKIGGGHWWMVHKTTRDLIWQHYRPGQQDDKNPSPEYCAAARRAVIEVAVKEGRKPDTRLYDAYLKLEPLDKRDLDKIAASFNKVTKWRRAWARYQERKA